MSTPHLQIRTRTHSRVITPMNSLYTLGSEISLRVLFNAVTNVQFCFSSLKELVCQIEVLEKVSYQSNAAPKSTVFF